MINALQRSAGNKAVCALVGRSAQGRGRRAVARQPLPSLTPDELMRFMHGQRGFGTSKPGPPKIDPKLRGKPTGKGYQTYAAVQIADRQGNQVKVSIGAYLGGRKGHGETEAIAAMRRSLGGADVRGGKLMVAVEQLPCKGCDSEIKRLARELGLARYEVYVPERARVKGSGNVKPKTASTTVFQGGNPATRIKLIDAADFDVPKPPPSTVPRVTTPAPKLPSSPKIRASNRAMSKVLRGLRTAGGALPTALKVLQAISSVLTAAEFMRMASSSLTGKGFIHTEAIAHAEAIETRADELAREYPKASEEIGDQSTALLLAPADLESLGDVVSELADLIDDLDRLEEEIREQLARVRPALKEATAKHQLAVSILKDRAAMTGIAMASGGTTFELGRIFAASDDFRRIASALGSAVEDLAAVHPLVRDDLAFARDWFDQLFDVGEAVGVFTSFELFGSIIRVIR